MGFFGGFRFRVWMPLVAVLLVLLSIATFLLYVLPAARARLADFSEGRALTPAAAASSALEDLEGSDRRRELVLAARTADGELLVVDRQRRIVARAGPPLLSPSPPQEVLRLAAEGDRSNGTFGDQRVAVVPLVRGGELEGSVVFAPGGGESTINDIFVRSGIEAALVSTILGGGLALLLATLLSGRVERLTSGAHAIEGGDLSHRIEPGFDDELGELARSFNSMAGRLQTSFDKLKESGATLNAILNNLAEGVMAVDLEGNVMFVNLAARDMLNLGSRGPLGEAPDPWMDFDLPAAVRRCAREEERIEARVSAGEDFFGVKLERMPAFDDHGGGVLVVVRDLSEGRRLEANQQRFLANAAHELKTPITTVVGASELLLTESEDDPETRRRFLEHIHREARRMQRLSDTLLRLARTGADLRDPEMELLDLDGLARDAVERIRPLSEAEGLDLTVEGRGGRVRADREWIEQCLLIVLRNAVQHSGRQGKVRARLAGGAVSVGDEGVGIPEGDLPRVFERFHRGGDSGGFGLGLAICKDLVERMGGSITLDSEEGVGTTVRIELTEVS